MTEDEQALLRTILEHPHADLPRLVMADFLEENGQADRGEFIRVQCELTGYCWQCEGKRFLLGCAGDKSNPPCPRCEPLGKRERELLVEFGAKWYEVFGHLPAWFADPPGYLLRLSDGQGAAAIVRRGFVDEVRCPLAWWVGEECPCVAIRTDPPTVCETCHGTGITPANGPGVVARHPVTTVAITDREPLGQGSWWMWFHAERQTGHAIHPESDIPGEVWYRLPKDEDGLAGFRTRDAALAALSRALLNPAREAAGLPPLPPEVTP